MSLDMGDGAFRVRVPRGDAPDLTSWRDRLGRDRRLRVNGVGRAERVLVEPVDDFRDSIT